MMTKIDDGIIRNGIKATRKRSIIDTSKIWRYTMKTKTLLVGLLLSAVSFSTANAGDTWMRVNYPPMKDFSAYKSVDATVMKVESDLVFLRTEGKAIRTIGVKELNRNGIRSVHPGDRIDLKLDRGNLILAVTQAGGKGNLLGHAVTGSAHRFEGLIETITRKTGKGEEITSYRRIGATVTKVVSDMVFFRTAEKTMRNSSVIEVKRSGISSIQAGDKVNLILDRGNSMIAITEAGSKGDFISHEIAGTVQHFDVLSRWIALKTEKGEVRSFELRDAAATKLNGVKEGTAIIVALDKQNWVMDAY